MPPPHQGNWEGWRVTFDCQVELRCGREEKNVSIGEITWFNHTIIGHHIKNLRHFAIQLTAKNITLVLIFIYPKVKNFYIPKDIISFTEAAGLGHCWLSPPTGRSQSPLTLHKVPNSINFSWAISYNPVSHVSQWLKAIVWASPLGSACRQPPFN